MVKWTSFFCLIFLMQNGFSQELPTIPDDSTLAFLTLNNATAYTGEIIDTNRDNILLKTDDEGLPMSRNEIRSVEVTGESKPMRILMKDGTEYQGFLIQTDETQLTLINKNGRVRLQQEKVKRIKELSEKEWVKIVMRDGTIYEGYQMTAGSEPATIFTESGKIKYNPNLVKHISKKKDSSDYKFKNPLPNIYFLSPSAIPLKKGASYYHNQSVAFNSYQTALNKNISIGGGIEFLSLFFNRSPSVYGNIKISGSASSRFHYGGGLFSGAALTRDDFSPILFAAPYAVVTLGGPDHNYTFGGGTILTNESEDNNYWIFNLTVMDRMTDKVSVLSNNFLFYNELGINIFGLQGVRIMGESRAFDIALILNASFLFDRNLLPYAGFIQRF